MKWEKDLNMLMDIAARAYCRQLGGKIDYTEFKYEWKKPEGGADIVLDMVTDRAQNKPLRLRLYVKAGLSMNITPYRLFQIKPNESVEDADIYHANAVYNSLMLKDLRALINEVSEQFSQAASTPVTPEPPIVETPVIPEPAEVETPVTETSPAQVTSNPVQLIGTEDSIRIVTEDGSQIKPE